MKIFIPLLIIFLFFQTSGEAQIKKANNTRKSIKVIDELAAFYDISRLPQYLDHAIPGQVSTYDTTGGNNDGFNGNYSYLRRNADSSLIIFDIRGNGVINRIWTPTPTEDTFDFYIDDTIKTVLSIKYSDLFSNKVSPFLEPLCGNHLGGFYCYFPILFQKSCRIVCRGKKMQFHQIQYKLYPRGTVSESFSSLLTIEGKNAIQNITDLWNKKKKSVSNFKMTAPDHLLMDSSDIEINPGQTKTVFNLNQGGRILGIEFSPAESFSGLSKKIDIKISWDNEINPAVFCPLADFFGYAFGSPSMESLLLGSEKNTAYCYFPMPFDAGAKIELIYRVYKNNENDSPIKCKARIYYSKDKRNAETEGKFYAIWHKNIITEKNHPHVFLNISGRGHYVGSLLQAQGLHPGMTSFFEGDDSTSVDGIPRIHGTGSEDYFNGGWYALPDRWDTRLSLPMHGALDYSLLFCRTGGYRLYLADKIPFEKTIFQSMEHGPDAVGVPADYTSLSFYYCDTGPANVMRPTNELAEVRILDTLMVYPQMMDFNIGGEMSCKTFWRYNTGGLSFIFTANDESQLKISLDKIPFGKYKLFADFTRYAQGATFSIWQRQKQVSDWISSYKADEERIESLYLGDVNIQGGINSMTIEFKTNPGRNGLFLNRFILTAEK